MTDKQPYQSKYPTIERLHHLRQDTAWLQTQMRAPHARYLPVWRSQNYFAPDTDLWQPKFLSAATLGDSLERADSCILLGEIDELVYFALGMPETPEAPLALTQSGRFGNMRQAGIYLDSHDGALLAYGRMMTYWHAQHRYCGHCGAATINKEAGHLRECSNPECKQPHYPRTDSAVIVLITHDERCLLARQATWPQGRYAIIAGFLEPGETIEQAVAREVAEETDIRVANVRYRESQPWPYPGTVMLGFTAEAASTDIYLRDGELEAARWFSREEIVNALHDGSLSLPSGYSISYRLIEAWFDAAMSRPLREYIASTTPHPVK